MGWDHSTFSKNRDRLLDHEVVEAFFTEVMTLADKQGLLSKEHFSVDGTLIQAWASHKSFVPKDGADDSTPQGGGRNGQADWKDKPRGNAMHASTTDADARLYKKSDNTPAVLGYLGHILIENRSGLVVGAVANHADSMAERAQALRLLERTPGRHPKTAGADKAYDTRDFVADCRARNVTPHVARRVKRWAAAPLMDARHAMVVMKSAKSFASALKSISVGARRWARFDRRCIGDYVGWISISS